MGALEIRQAKENLRPLGSFRMPELNNGAERAWDAQAAAAMKAADAARTAGMATVQGISRRGQIVADTLQGLGKLAFDFAERENDRIAKEGVLELQRRTNEEMYGNGQDKAGRLNENIGDVGAWVKSVKDWNEATVQDVEKDMSGVQKRIFRERIANQQLGLQTTVAQHAARTSLKKQVTTAEAWSAEKLGVAASSFGNPATRDACVKAYVDAKMDELEVKGVPEEARPALMRLAMRDLLSKGWETAIAGWSAELANNPEVNEDPVAVRKAFEAKAAEAEKVGFIVKDPNVSYWLGNYGKRFGDNGFKGTGWLGVLPVKGGGVATEYSIGVNIDGKEMEIPTLVPGLTPAEVRMMTDDIIPNHKPLPDSIVKKAVDHAKKCLRQGKSVFANDTQGLTESEKELFRQRLQEAGIRAADRARALKAENTKIVVEEFDGRERDLIRKPGDEGYVGALEAWAKDGRLAKYDPERSKKYQTFAKAIREAEERKDSAAADFLKKLPKKEILQDSLIDAVERVTQARIGGVSGPGVQMLQMDALQKYQLAMRYGFVDAEFRGKFEKRLNGELKEQTLAALRKWYHRWGVHPETDATGRVTKGEIEGATGDVLIPKPAGAPDGANGSISKEAFFRASNMLIDVMEASPNEYNRTEAMDTLILQLEGNVLGEAYGAQIEAAEAGQGFVTMFMDAQADLTAGVNYFRLAREAEAKKEPSRRKSREGLEAERLKLDEKRREAGIRMRKLIEERNNRPTVDWNRREDGGLNFLP